MEEHPLFEKVSDEVLKDDPCIKAMREETDEAQKVIRNGGSIWHAVYSKNSAKASKKQIMDKYFIW